MGEKYNKIEKILIKLNKLKRSQLPKYYQVLQNEYELYKESVEQESEDLPLTLNTTPKSPTHNQRKNIPDNAIQSPSEEKLEVLDPHEEGTMLTSSSSQRNSKKRGTGYNSLTSQNSKQRYR